ncbi:PIN domain-containing protein [Polymorphobacter sp. PAMC 29334]|uniref:PIN domain-containing protein n=1 Tax=Polymorphobacter sp. PAMC 29334 TaxID=2862331 RepID=UPI001C77B468|nr:PIN domain-containing protein [Polymorphobacter sp. PAMC 29334]QYE34775.1 PIN domain-containing protein [Polymorphobacter sp. PAMC 29334]
MFLIDTNIAIHLRDLHDAVTERVASLDSLPLLSIVSRVELEGGVIRFSELREFRRSRVDSITRNLTVLDFGVPELAAYRRIVEVAGYSRPRILDRMIAATALVHDLTVITMNGSDFRDAPGLKLEIWPSPAE